LEIQEQGYPGKETQVKAFVREIRPPKEVLAVWRFETPPGEQAQVDWAHVGYVVEDGVRRKAYAFVMVLGYSRFRFVAFTTRTDTAELIRLHLEAFQLFGGFPKTIHSAQVKPTSRRAASRASRAGLTPGSNTPSLSGREARAGPR